MEPVRDRPVRSAILLNRCITRAHSVSDARQALQDLGYDVLSSTVPRLEVYAQSFGMPVLDTGCHVWRQVVRDLIARCARAVPGAVITRPRHQSGLPAAIALKNAVFHSDVHDACSSSGIPAASSTGC